MVAVSGKVECNHFQISIQKCWRIDLILVLVFVQLFNHCGETRWKHVKALQRQQQQSKQHTWPLTNIGQRVWLSGITRLTISIQLQTIDKWVRTWLKEIFERITCYYTFFVWNHWNKNNTNQTQTIFQLQNISMHLHDNHVCLKLMRNCEASLVKVASNDEPFKAAFSVISGTIFILRFSVVFFMLFCMDAPKLHSNSSLSSYVCTMKK